MSCLASIIDVAVYIGTLSLFSSNFEMEYICWSTKREFERKRYENIKSK